MTETAQPQPQVLDLFPYIYKHSGRPVMHLTQFAKQMGMPAEPFRRIVEAGYGPWKPAPTPSLGGGTDYWFIRDMLATWRRWFLGKAPVDDLIAAKQIIIDWDRSQPARDYSFLDDREPSEYFRYFLDHEYKC